MFLDHFDNFSFLINKKMSRQAGGVGYKAMPSNATWWRANKCHMLFEWPHNQIPVYLVRYHLKIMMKKLT